MSQTLTDHHNPYVGPRPFERGETLYGRTHEMRELQSLLLAERIVLLYSPSGAGKTSLLQAALLPRLEKRFEVLPVARVNEVPPSELTLNRYLYSLLTYLEKNLPPEQRLAPAELAGLSLTAYLERRRAAQEKSPRLVLILDQFEEILTLDPTNPAEKEEFFKQVGEALYQPWLWAIFSLREDYIAGLDPYLRLIPTRLKSTFRLELLDQEATQEAIQGPAQEQRVSFSDAAAERLITDLCQVRVQQRDGQIQEKEGLYVEPVQLQVVCSRLWDKKFPPDTPLPAGASIEPGDVDSVGDVDTALAGYYAACIQAIAAETGVSERAIRGWCGEALITEQGIRSQVLSGPKQGLAEAAVQKLVAAHLVRGEERRGSTWYELTHDRLIKPVRDNNTAWQETHLHPLQRQAALWDKSQRPDGLLLKGVELAEAEQWAAATSLEDFELDFLHDSLFAEQKYRQSRRILHMSLAMNIIAVAAIVAAFMAWNFFNEAQESADEAQAQTTRAVLAEVNAKQQAATAIAALKNAAAAQAEVTAANQIALASQQTAEAAKATIATALFSGTPDIEQRQTAEAALTTATAAIMQAEATRRKADEIVAESLKTISTSEAPGSIPTATPIRTPTPPSANTSVSTSLPTILLPEGMALVPAGVFTTGDGRSVNLDDFYIDLYEITNAKFSACVKAGVCVQPSATRSNTRGSYYGNPEFDDHPVIYVNWFQAKAFCEWVGKNLPTQEQWEKAALGTDNRTYPWGKGLDCHKANYWYQPADMRPDCILKKDTTKVGSYPEGVNLSGIYDMIGNVWEWTIQSTETRQVFRGGSWMSSGEYVVPTTSRVDRDPNDTYDDVGFRCVKD